MRSLQYTTTTALLFSAAVPLAATTLEDIDFFVDNMVQGGARDQFPAMTNPEPVRPDEASYVADDDLVLGVYLDGEAWAYPENLGWRHEIINDKLNDRFISVSFVPSPGRVSTSMQRPMTAGRSNTAYPDSCSTATSCYSTRRTTPCLPRWRSRG